MRRIYLCVAILSAGVLAYEILLTRLLSIVQWHHFAYMIISLALLGFGASGTFLTFFGRSLARRFQAAFAANAVAFALSSYACFAAAQSLPLNLLEITWGPGQILWLTLTYLLLMLPFFFAANCIALTFMRFPQLLGSTYASDLAGAAIGCGAVLWLLHLTSPEGALLPIATTGVLAGAIMVIDARLPRWVACAAVLAVAGYASQSPPLELRVSPYKGLAQVGRVAGATVVASRSSPLGKLDVLENGTVPFRYAPGLSVVARTPIPEQVAIFTDADGVTMITRYDGEPRSIAFLDQLTSALAYHLSEIESVLVLGAGAGADVLQALYHGAGLVTAVELNPQIVDLVREDYADFSGNIYRDGRVEVRIAEARDFVERDSRHYDLVQMSAVDAFGATASGLRALNESYLYTVEALGAYLDRLEPGGLLSITRWIDLPPRDAVKLFAAVVAALEDRGEEPARGLAWIRGWGTTTLVAKNGAFAKDQIAALRDFAEERQFDLAYYPGMRRSEANRHNVLAEPRFHDAAVALLGSRRERFLADYKFRIAPSTDDRPFHFHFFKWRHLPEMLALRTRGGMSLLELGYIVLIASLAQALMVSLVLVVLPLLWLRGRSDNEGSAWSRGGLIGYFLLVGLAFLFVEVAFIQIFVRFLGHPVYAVAVVLASFLLFAAVGSWLVGSHGERLGDTRKLVIAVAVIATLCVAYVMGLPALLVHLAGAGAVSRAAIAVALVAPLALAMGMPFPLGLRSLEGKASSLIPWAWAVNGCASVVSAVLAVVLAMYFGFSAVILGAAALYVLAAVVGWRGVKGGGRAVST